MLKDEKLKEIYKLVNEIEDSRSDATWAYAYDHPESVRKEFVSRCVDARYRLIDFVLRLSPDDFKERGDGI